MKQIGFGVYDWEKSPWVNSRDESKRVSMRAARKASLWKRELPGLELPHPLLGNNRINTSMKSWDSTLGRFHVHGNAIGNQLQTPENGQSRIIGDSYRVVKYGPGTAYEAPSQDNGQVETLATIGAEVARWDFRDDHPEYEKLGTHKITDTTSMLLMSYKDLVEFKASPTQLVDGEFLNPIKIRVGITVHEEFTGYAEGGCVLEWDITEEDRTNYYQELSDEYYPDPWDFTVLHDDRDLWWKMYNTSHTNTLASNEARSISRIDMLPFVDAYQAQEGSITDKDGTILTPGTQITKLQEFIDHITNDTLLKCIVLTEHAEVYSSTTGGTTPIRSTFKYVYTDSTPTYLSIGACTTTASFGTVTLPSTTNTYNTLLINAGNTSEQSLGSEEVSLPSSKSSNPPPYAEFDACIISKILTKAINLDIFTSLQGGSSFKTLVVNKDNLLLLADLAMSTLNTINTAQIAEARKTDIGAVLYEFGNLDSILNSDVSKMDEFYLSFYISNYDNVTELEDVDEATDIYKFRYMVDMLATTENPEKWREYFWAVIEYRNYEGYCIGYMPNWDAIKDAPPWVFQTVLTACMRLDYGVPEPKHKTSWVSIIIAVIIIVIVSVATWGSATGPTAAAAFAASATIASSVLMIGYQLTGSEALAKASTIAGYVSMAGALYSMAQQGLKELVKQLAKSMLSTYSLVIRVVTYGLNKSYKKKLGEKYDKIATLEEKVDGVNERIANEHLDKLSKIQKFMHGEHITTRYTYQYDTPYNEPYEEK